MNQHLSDIVTVAVLAFIGWRLLGGVRHVASRGGRSLARTIVGGIRWRHIWPVPFVLTGVVLVATVLMRIPGLDWGWWTAFGGQGNPVFGSNDSTVGTVWEWLVPAVFMILLIPALPVFAYAEERGFRTGAEHWNRSRRIYKVLGFGLVHALIGIPIGTALALSVGGAYFMTVYLRSSAAGATQLEATLESARAHTAYNGVIIAVVIVTVALTA